MPLHLKQSQPHRAHGYISNTRLLLARTAALARAPPRSGRYISSIPFFLAATLFFVIFLAPTAHPLGR